MYTSKLHQLRAFWDLTMFERYAVKNNKSVQTIPHFGLVGHYPDEPELYPNSNW